MERPLHELTAAHSNKDKGIGLSIVIGIHVVAISALVIGLSSTAIQQGLVELTATMTPKKAVQQLPPPPIAVVKPPVALAPPLPVIVITAPPKPVIAPVESVAVPPPPPPTAPKAIARTHISPPYPALSQRLGEQGTTGLTCEIGVDGKPISCAVSKSSGSPRLDEAALSYVKDHYTWEPATSGGKPVAAKTQLDLVWDLKNTQ